MTTHAASSRPADGDDDDRAGAGRPDAPGLGARAARARARLEPERLAVPAPRSPFGVVVPVSLRPADAAATPAPARPPADALVADLEALEGATDDAAARTVARIGELTAAGVPGHGWSAEEGITVEALTGARDRAGVLRDAAAALLEQLDDEDHPSAAVVVDGLAASLRVIAVVADLEVFARTG